MNRPDKDSLRYLNTPGDGYGLWRRRRWLNGHLVEVQGPWRGRRTCAGRCAAASKVNACMGWIIANKGDGADERSGTGQTVCHAPDLQAKLAEVYRAAH